ncbi:MAG: histidinol-phosphate transaminase [Candidatus Dormibacteria bacterium]
MSRFRRASLRGQPSYAPGEQPADGAGWLKLNTNEAPLGPSPRVAPAVTAAAADLRRYPDSRGEPLRSALAAHHQVEADQILVGNGADDVLDCCFRAFCDPAGRVVQPAPSYSLLPILTRQHGGVPVNLPLDEQASLPVSLGTIPGVLRIAVNPNAPTGVWLPPEAMESLFAHCEGVVVIDEAYCDFAPASCVPLLDRHESWLVVRTFSKSHALAGLRVGYAVGARALIADLYAVKASYPVGRCAIAGATAALQDDGHHRRLVDAVAAERRRITDVLGEMGWRVLPSEANFVFARPPGGRAVEVIEHLRDQLILVRHFGDDPRFGDWVRITIGTGPDMDRLVGALRGQ